MEGVLPSDRIVRRRQRLIMLGLLVTFVGIGGFWLALPTAPGELTRGAPFAAVGAVGLWVGGMLLGAGSRGRRSRTGAP